MTNHEHFRELCAAASIGQASPEELLDLERHASHCEACRRAYFDYLSLAALQFAAEEENPTVSAQEAQECLSSDLLTRRFLDRAEREGIVFFRELRQEVGKPSRVSSSLRRERTRRTPAMAMAVALLLGVAVWAGYFYGNSSGRMQPAVHAQGKKDPRPESQASATNARIAELTAENARLSAKAAHLSANLRMAEAEFTASQTKLDSTVQDRQKARSDRDALSAQLQSIQQELTQSETAAASAQQDATRLRDRNRSLEASIVANQVRMHDLSEEVSEDSSALKQERQLLALGHDVTDLMGARNLHIVDVVDTDPRGKTRPAFGRIFFTEGKSLIFYAYDLNEAKIAKADYEYQIWAKKEGQDQSVQKLGIFYSDDKAQRRWVFKCDDPKVLSDIDSVFVTLQPANSDPSRPKGPNLMYAYLRGQANHP